MITRKFIKGWLVSFSLVGFICASQFAMATSDSGTLTPGGQESCTTPPYTMFIGYDPPNGWGSYSPTTLTGGYTVTLLMDAGASGVSCEAAAVNANFSVSGFSSNPGSSWLTSVTCDGVELLASNGTFGYSSGTASWVWSNSQFYFSIGDQVSCTIVHN